MVHAASDAAKRFDTVTKLDVRQFRFNLNKDVSLEYAGERISSQVKNNKLENV